MGFMEPKMTSSLRRNLRRPGFTLVELLVVMAILILLASIVLPMIGHAYNVARRARMAADLQVIGEALEAYRHDFGDYPRPSLTPPPSNPQSTIPANTPVTGAAVLCWALIAPGPSSQDGYGDPTNQNPTTPGPGFRLRGTTGEVKGPYLPTDRFRIGTVMNGVVNMPVVFNDSQDVLGDRNYSPILYFVASRTASPNVNFVANGSGDPPPVFNFDDNRIYVDPTVPGSVANGTSLMRGASPRVMSYRLGDLNMNGHIDGSETPIATGPYLLWCAGPSVTGRFGSDDDVVSNGTDLQLVTPLKAGVVIP
jgi:prepilin-type N-terminal cleavage/methylation domain-containing protein